MMEGYTILSLLLCLSVASAFSNYEVRLAGSHSSTSQGRVEVYVDGEWGTVCDDHWELVDADVVCRQLGFPGAFRPMTHAQLFGEGSGEIFLDNVECVGSETSIMDCPMNAIGDHDCDHGDDAGVMCRVAQDEKRKMEDLEFYEKEDMTEKEEEAAADKKDADLKKKDILQALFDLLANLKDK